jgi:3-oxoacyl-(acyl-carrier-protein) synthase
MPERRVVVTGTGVITSIGHNTDQFWNNIVNGQSGIGPYEAVDSTLVRFQNGAEVKNYDPTAYFEQKELDLMDRFAQFALIAAKEAVKQSGMDCAIENGRNLWYKYRRRGIPGENLYRSLS